MSVDGGIYAIKTLKGDGFEFRVAHVEGFDSIEWSDTEPNPNGGIGWYTNNPDVLIKNARLVYTNAPVFVLEKDAVEEAYHLQYDMGQPKCGIFFPEIPREF